MRLIAFLSALSLLSACATVGAEQGKTAYVPAGYEANYDTYQFAPAMKYGDTVVISGVPASGPGSYEDKVRRMFERTKMELALAGASMDDVVEITTFHTTPKDSPAFDDEFEHFKKIHAEYFHPGTYPAWTAIGGIVLLSPTAVVEMRTVAVIGSGKKAAVLREKH